MRIRSIKPEFWRSDDTVALPISARLTFIGLWSYVDDNGVGSAKLSSIVSDLYAEDLVRDPPETLQRVSGDIQAIENRGMIVRYNDGKRELLYVTAWDSHQLVNRPSKGHGYPLPPAEIVEAGKTLMQTAGDPPEGLSAGAGEQGNRGAEEMEQGSGPPAPPAQPVEPIRLDVDELVVAMIEELKARDIRFPDNLDSWKNAARLLIDKDKRDLPEALNVLRWSQRNSFWRKNIMAMPKFREKYDRLRAEMQDDLEKQNRKNGHKQENFDWLDV